MSDDDMKMDGDEYTKAMFFSTEEEVAALTAAKQRRPLKRTKTDPPDIQALRHFVRLVGPLDYHTQRAAIMWLVSKYLGINALRHADPPTDKET